MALEFQLKPPRQNRSKRRNFAEPEQGLKRFRPAGDEGDVGVENEWDEEGAGEAISEEEARGERRWWLLWAGVCLIGVFVGSVFLARQLDESADLEPVPAYVSARENEALAVAALRGFLGAQDVEGRGEFVLDRERVNPLMEEYYTREGVEPVGFGELVESQSVEIAGERWWWLRFLDRAQLSHVASMRETAEGPKLDWESFVAYGEMSWERFLSERPTEPTQMRVYFQHTDYYNFKYGDNARWLGFRIEPRDAGGWIYGYVERGTAIYQSVGASVVPGSRQPLNVALRFEDDAGADNLVVVDALLQRSWISPSVLGGGVAEPE